MTIRDAEDTDLSGVLSIYNDVIRTSTAIYTEAPSSIEERRSWWEQRVAQGYPVIVAADSSGIAGFASFGDFRGTWPGYRHSVEHSVHVRDDRRGEGLGTLLVTELLRRAAALGKHVMIAGIDAANTPSIRFHHRLGFQPVGTFHEVGYKFGRWLDLHFMERLL
jgi:phosphinothricin acetyltransferase